MMVLEAAILEKYAQVISVEMMDALKESAQEKGISLSMEIALRLMVSMTEPELGTGSSLFNSILCKDFTEEEAVAECKRKRHATLYLYEMEKLRLFLRFEQTLPRNIKESFTVIDVKEAAKKIRAELEAEEQANKQKGR